MIEWLFSRPNRALGGKLGGSDGTRTRGLLRDRRSNQLNYARILTILRFLSVPSDVLSFPAVLLAATILGSNIAFIDDTVVNVVLPALQSNLAVAKPHPRARFPRTWHGQNSGPDHRVVGCLAIHHGGSRLVVSTSG